MCALGYFLERAGIMTTGISLVRENAASMKPPRTLWVSFPLGRPLGKPDDAAFQHQVIAAALDLLKRETGPVLEDFPHDVPVAESQTAPACPISFPIPDDASGTWVARLAEDLASVKPWYDLSRRRRGRTLTGVSGRSPEENIVELGRLLDEGRLPHDDLKWFKRAIEDLKALYVEALTAQPGNYDHEQVQRVFWHDSVLGAALLRFYRLMQRSPDGRLKLMARLIVPRQAVGEATGGEIDLGISGGP